MKVLFIGNSHTYFNDMPRLFALMCGELTGEVPEVSMLAFSGKSLRWHCREFFSVRFALLYGGYDYCVIQQQAHPMPDEAETRRGFADLISLCGSRGIAPVVFMTWAEKKKPENAAKMSVLYRNIADEHGALLAPVGELFALVGRERPDIDLYWSDGEHASAYGDYLCACALVKTMLPGADVSMLSDKAIDFRVRIERESGLPKASLAADALVELDAEKAAALRLCVNGFTPQNNIF